MRKTLSKTKLNKDFKAYITKHTGITSFSLFKNIEESILKDKINQDNPLSLLYHPCSRYTTRVTAEEVFEFITTKNFKKGEIIGVMFGELVTNFRKVSPQKPNLKIKTENLHLYSEAKHIKNFTEDYIKKLNELLNSGVLEDKTIETINEIKTIRLNELNNILQSLHKPRNTELATLNHSIEIRNDNLIYPFTSDKTYIGTGFELYHQKSSKLDSPKKNVEQLDKYTVITHDKKQYALVFYCAKEYLKKGTILL